MKGGRSMCRWVLSSWCTSHTHTHTHTQFQPPVVSRALCGYVGLKNAGATCYMNSVLQQLYMTHPIREVILSAELDAEDENK